MIPENELYSEFSAVNSFNTTVAQCTYLKSDTEEEFAYGFINYMQLFYCQFNDEKSRAVPFSLFWLFVLFTGLGVTADDFLCPSLLIISKTLRLSQNIAGVTFLAFGNGAPDIFSSLAGIKQSRPELVIGELFGAGIFVVTVVAGSIFLNKQFPVMKRPLLRDVIFYMFSAYLTWFIFFHGKILLRHAIAFILLYILYIIVVVVGRIVHNRYRTKSWTPNEVFVKNSSDINKDGEVNGVYTSSIIIVEQIAPQSRNSRSISNTGSVNASFEGIERLKSSGKHLIHHHLDNTIYMITHEDDVEYAAELRSRSESVLTSHTFNCHRRSIASSTHSVTTLLTVESRLETFSEWNDFLVHICPINVMEWQEESLFCKICQIWKAPVYFLLTITIPVVDLESHKHNWCRILNSLHCITGPLVIVLLTGNIKNFVGAIPLAVLVIIVGFIFAFVVYFTSIHEDPPKYHWIFGYLGFMVSVVWIYALANEVVFLLKAIGIMFDLSDAILGLTVLAWGNSLGDLISNLSMSRQGFPRMGVSACFGGPLLNLLLGIGLPYTIMLSEEKGAITLEYTRMVSLLAATLLISLAATLIILLITGFESKKLHGLLLFAIYVIYVVIAALIEMKVI